MEPARSTAEPAPGFLKAARALRRVRRRARLRRDDHRFPLVRPRAAHLYGVRPTCRPGARRWATGSRSRRSRQARADGARQSANVRDASSCCPPPMAPRRPPRGPARSMEIYGARPDRTIYRQGATTDRRPATLPPAHGLEHHIKPVGFPSNLLFATLDAELQASQAFRTLFLQELLLGGVLGQSFVITAAHRKPTWSRRSTPSARPCPSTARRWRPGAPTACCTAGRWRRVIAATPSPAASADH